MPPSCCPCGRLRTCSRLGGCLRASRVSKNRRERPTPRFDSGLKALTRRVSLRVSTDPTRRTVCGASPASSPHRPPFFLPLTPSSLFTRNTTQAAPEAGNETYVGHYFRSGQSGRPIRAIAVVLPTVGHRDEATTRRATFRRVQI